MLHLFKAQKDTMAFLKSLIQINSALFAGESYNQYCVIWCVIIPDIQISYSIAKIFIRRASKTEQYVNYQQCYGKLIQSTIY